MKGDSPTRMWRTSLFDTPGHRIASSSATTYKVSRLATGSDGKARVRVIALLAVIRRLVPLQTSPSRCLLWCFRRNCIEKSRSPHPGRSCRRISLHESRSPQPYYMPLATSINDRQVRIRANHSAGHLNGNIRHEALEAACGRCMQLPLSF